MRGHRPICHLPLPCPGIHPKSTYTPHRLPNYLLYVSQVLKWSTQSSFISSPSPCVPFSLGGTVTDIAGLRREAKGEACRSCRCLQAGQRGRPNLSLGTLRAACSKQKAPVKLTDQTLDWHVMQDPKDETKFCIVERYEQESSQQYHLNNPVRTTFSLSLPAD